MSLWHQVEHGPALQVCDMPMNVKNKYFNSSWRRNDAHCPGGFMMESSVHFLAALRMLAAAGGAWTLYKRRAKSNKICRVPIAENTAPMLAHCPAAL